VCLRRQRKRFKELASYLLLLNTLLTKEQNPFPVSNMFFYIPLYGKLLTCLRIYSCCYFFFNTCFSCCRCAPLSMSTKVWSVCLRSWACSSPRMRMGAWTLLLFKQLSISIDSCWERKAWLSSTLPSRTMLP